ncbi:MAG: membrane protein insertase YidC, partial [Desulfovibrionales bacterium]|nr:membrane protein insertase YidC [Desulfovibrionales bacterium]
MDLQRTLLIAGLVVVGYLTVLQWNQDYNQPPASQSELQLPATSAPDIQGFANESDAPELGHDSVPDSADAAPSAELVTVTTDTLNVTIDTRGGDIVRVELPEYPRVKGQTDPFVLLENTSHRTFVAQSGLTGANGPDRKGKPIYSSAKASYSMGDSSELTVDLTLKADNGVNITKRFSFVKGTYQVRVDYRIQNGGSEAWRGNYYAQLKRDNSEDPSREISSAGNINTYLGAAVRTVEKQYEKLEFEDFASAPFKEQVQGGYAAIVQHYFVTAWVPKQAQQNTFQTRVYNGNNIVTVVEPAIDVAPGQTKTVGATLYVGPKNQEVLGSLADGLDLTIDYGMLWWFAKPLFLLLSFIQSVLGNWGWSIIALTIIVESLFYPLSAATYRSMAKMRKISPKMQSLKEKHGEDKQALSQAMMKLYKEEKVNPMGGCLPILVQMPVFIALYWVLIESVELRQAPWLGWIQDLSQM